MNNPKKILIVDDEELVVKALTDKLTSENFLTESASDGQEALKKVEQFKPDLVLLDIIMPKLDGISVLKKLKGSNDTKNIPIIVLTNLYDDKRIQEALKDGSTDYLIKVDHSLGDIVKQIKEKLGQ